MSKIFGKTGKGGQDWFVSDAYADKEIKPLLKISVNQLQAD